MLPRPAVSERAAIVALQVGAIAVVLVAAPYKQFDLDRFFVPKELALHLVAFVATIACLVRARQLKLARVDEMLALFLGLGLVSALFATNWWLAGRAVAISVSGALCFWSARTLSRRGFEHPLVSALALAAIVGAVTALLQAYGLRTEYMSLNRAPGGTFGNRNFMAHLCVIGLPALSLTALRARSRRGYLGWALGVLLIGAALVMSRSRAAWLALIVAAVLVLPLGYLALRRGRGTLRLRRLLLLPVVAALGAGASLVIPNTLDWNSDSPYLDTAKSVVNYKEGSGRGRLIQYGNTLKMTLHHPLLGVGPGNWAVDYPHFAKTNDPSLSTEGMTSNPWPSSDWMTFLSERGIAAFVVLALAVLALVGDAMRSVRTNPDAEERLRGAVLLATIGVLLVVGSFDAVLLLPVPALAAWALLGALSAPSRDRRVIELSIPRRVLAMLVVAVVTLLGAAQSVAQLSAMAIFSTTSRTSRLERASQVDRGSYRIHARLAASYLGRGNCSKARVHARAANSLFPNAPLPKRILRQCGE